jgi:hypothetical protein
MTSGAFQINDGGDQFPRSLIVFVFPAILVFANPEDLAFPIQMFNHNSLFCQLLIILFLLFRQRLFLGRFERHLCLLKQLEYPDKALIYFDLGILVDFQTTFLQNLEIVFGAARTAHRENHSRQKTDDQQGFQGMMFFFPE